MNCRACKEVGRLIQLLNGDALATASYNHDNKFSVKTVQRGDDPNSVPLIFTGISLELASQVYPVIVLAPLRFR